MVYSCTIRGMETINDWVNEATGSDSWRAIAARLDTTHPTIQRRLRDQPADAIHAIANAYGVNPIPGFIAAGIITEFDLRQYTKGAAIEDFSDLELAQVIVERLQTREAEDLSNVTEFPSPGIRGVGHDDLPSVADSSPDEPEEGTDFD